MCRSCPHEQEGAEDESVVYRRDIHTTQREKLIVPPDVVHDPTLSRTDHYECRNCPNRSAVFWQLPEAQQEDAMSLIFVCTACKIWRLEGKK